MIDPRYRVIVLFLFLAVCATIETKGQLISGSSSENIEIPPDSLRLEHEWWLGANISAHYAMGFGTQTVQYVGGTAPEAPALSAQTQGGFGYGIAFAPTLEYRAFRSPLGLMMSLGIDYRFMSSSSLTPVANGSYAFNATFESNSTVLYGTIALMAKYSVGVRGFFLLGGPFFDIPLSTSSYVWQHEVLPDGVEVGELPGFPNTSIKFNTDPAFRPRVGLQIGFGTDILTGLFGYTGQLLSPYIMIQGATPVISEPTAWNTLMVRGGVIWRVGM